jgi:hypothetical protein
MAVRLKPIDVSQVQTGSVRRRAYRLNLAQLGSMPQPAAPLHDFLQALPKLGAARQLLAAAELMARSALEERPIIWIVDGTLTQAGLTPLLVHLVRRGLVQCLVLSGEAAVNDYELAFHGKCAEDAAAGIEDGLLGLSRETGEGLNAIVNEGVKRGFSLGECLGRGILDRQPKHLMHSLLAAAAARLTLTTIHLCLGADGFQRYPGADGALLGKGSLKDTHLLGGFLSRLPAGALLVGTHRDAALNQVFLHAYALARNLNAKLKAPGAVRLGDGGPGLEELTDPAARQSVAGPIELTMPLLLGALFTLVE